MFKIEKLQCCDYESFRNMFLYYFTKECGVEYDIDKLRENLVDGYILKSFERGETFIDVAKKQDKVVGFIIYQINSKERGDEERLGSGYIAEFYVDSEYRRFGLGSLLLQNAEKTMKALGVNDVYLTSVDQEGVKIFYEKNGYINTHQIADNDQEIFEKSL